MTKYDEIYLISSLITNADSTGTVDLENKDTWNKLFLNTDTSFNEDVFFAFDKIGIIHYEEIGEDGFKPIRICQIKKEIQDYLKILLNDLEKTEKNKDSEIAVLNKRVFEILSFDPNRLSQEIKSTQSLIEDTKAQIRSNPVLNSLADPLSKIEFHFKSLSKVADNYEDVYKNIILPVKEEGKSGVRQTVRWAIIGIIASTILSALISWMTK
ncbi:hypothetical protein [Flavobacterium aquidurense]|uniref:hypothetical protein n=1 Tax=Flavobacterium aquidurense TaxID=362413 RepID=UPI00371D87CE